MLIGDIDIKSSNVYFTVQLKGDYGVANSTIPFERVISKAGDGLGNGIFTAPRSGTYYFSFDLLNNNAGT